ncbi:MAG: nucleoside phosphorylase [Chitinophagaceae bacterium]|nr:nucleoside phosphorylase [Chitinophagaceae bacterium]
MQSIPESEFILNNRGAIYHLNLLPEEIADTIILVGDPNRVTEVSKYFDKTEIASRHREFITHTGYIGKKRISVVSTGIGTDNIDIAMNELDALVNIDFASRTIKPELKKLKIIRVGTSGSLQPDIPVDDFVASTHAIGTDNLLHFYCPENNTEEQQLLQSFLTQVPPTQNTGLPYISSSHISLTRHFWDGFHHGITLTCPGFYGPQGRVLRLGLANPDLLNRLSAYLYGIHRILNFEMETAAIYAMGSLLGHHCASLNAIVANRVNNQFSRNPQETIDRLIRKALEGIVSV